MTKSATRVAADEVSAPVASPVFTGNVGIGVTPEAWYSGFSALQLSDTGAIYSENVGGESSIGLTENAYIAADGATKYLTTDEASIYQQNNGTHNFRVAASGSADAAISWTDAMTIDNAGIVTKPLQPAFQAIATNTQSNKTVGTDHTVLFGGETFDVGSNFASNTFTAPVTGKYQLIVNVRAGELDSAAAYFHIKIKTSNRDYWSIFDPDFGQDANYWHLPLSILADMDAGDTAYVVFYQNGGAAQADIDGNGKYTNFSGYLAC